MAEGKTRRARPGENGERGRKRPGQGLPDGDTLFRCLLESAPDGIIIVDGDGRIVLVNSEAEQLFGYSRDELIGQPVEVLVPEGDQERHVKLRSDYLAAARTRTLNHGLKLNGRRKDGSEFGAEINLSPVEMGGSLFVISSVRDITERRRMEEALRESESLFRGLLESAPDGVLIVDGQGRIVLLNARTEELFGYQRDDLLGKPVEVLIPGHLRKAHAGYRAGYHSDPRVRPMGACADLVAVRKDGSGLPVDISLGPVQTEQGILIVSTIRDVSDRRRIESELTRERMRAQKYLDIAGVIIVAIDREGNVTLINRKGCDLLGYREDEIIGRNWFDAFLLADIKTEVMTQFLRLLAGEIDPAEYYENPVLTRSGEQRLIAWHNAVLRDEAGDIAGTLSSGEDITDRRRAEEELRESERWLSTTLMSIGDAVIATDADGRVKFMNPAAQALTGWDSAAAAGMPLERVFKIVSEQTGTPEEDPVEKVLREGRVVGLANHTLLVARDGTRTPIDDSGAPIRDSEGNVTGVVVVFHDISEQKQAGEELRRLTKRLLEVQEEERRQVAYDIHDGLGQLLTAASMHLEAFVGHRRPLPPDVETELAKSRRCLQDAVVEMRRMVSELGPLLLEEVGLVEASRRLLADVAERAGWETAFHDEAGVDRLDPMAEMALFRIVQEGLANAAKHAQTRKVAVGFRRWEATLLVEVRDWGKGFVVDRALNDRGQGRQVGLVGMRERAALIGGALKIESVPGEGTTLTVSAPVATAPAPLVGQKRKAEVVKMGEPGKGRAPSDGGISVLIADDHPMVREGLRSMLVAEGIQIVGEATSGAEAVEQAQRLNPDVVLMDVRMPDMDGLAATEVVKQQSPGASVIMVTSYESKDYLRRALDAGASGYILKGMSRESLIEAIRLVRGGGSLIDARLLSELLKEMGVEGSRFQGAEGALEVLTPREQDVLQHLVRGLTNKQIASEMHYSVGTVKNVVQRVIEKLGVSDRTQAAVYAVRAGLNPPP